MLTQEQVEIKARELIQAFVFEIQPGDQEDVGKALSKLLSLTVGVLDGVMGSEYTSSTMIAIGEYMASGEPQSRIRVTVIDKTQLN